MAHVDERNRAIILRMSVSDTLKSSNPGVSIKVTRRPSSMNVSVVSTVDVHEESPRPIATPASLTRLMNYNNSR